MGWIQLILYLTWLVPISFFTVSYSYSYKVCAKFHCMKNKLCKTNMAMIHGSFRVLSPPGQLYFIFIFNNISITKEYNAHIITE